MHNNMNLIQVPDKLNDIVNESLSIIYKKRKKVMLHKIVIGLSSIAALFTVILLFGKANPVLASKWPIIGHIFEQVETDISYKGNYSLSSEQLITNTNIEADTTISDSAYVQTSNGITMTISEVYYNTKALYLAVSIENEEEFPPDFKRTENMANYILDYDRLELHSTGKLNFCEQYVSPYYIEGKFTDMNTFIGIIRVDLSHLTRMPSDEELENLGIDSATFSYDEESFEKIREFIPDVGSLIEVPERFSYNICFTKIWADLFTTVPTEHTYSDGETITQNEPQRKDYDGEWNFILDVTLDTSQTQSIDINATNDNGLGISKVEKTPYEITAEEIIPSNQNKSDYFLVICDANGDLLDSQGDYADTYQVYGRDTSTISVFICDYYRYMDELKGYYWSEDYEVKKTTKNFAQYLSENALYSTVVNFEK